MVIECKAYESNTMALGTKHENISLNSLHAIRRVEDEFIKKLNGTRTKLDRLLNDFIKSGNITGIADVSLARRQVEQILIESGYFETTGALLNTGYQRAVETSHQMYQKLYSKAFQFSEVSLNRLNALKQLDLNQFKSLSDDGINAINRTFIDMTFGAIDKNKAIELVRGSVDKLGGYAETWVTTGLSAVYTESNTSLAQDNGITKFQYVGPVDKLTRPFCHDHIGQVMTEEEWNSLDNGQISPVFTYRGGYNCRHSLVGVANAE
jgi:hypothetical protein